ncbi:MAG: glycosyltransferase family 39 protein [Lewinellaceae bacterium]|nr:glycosyltransferase family 39 protein [Lewinellaceae bacterium]
MYAYATRFPNIPSWFPAILGGLILAVVSWGLDFNGLYGQDAHEYLRQSRNLLATFHGAPQAPVQMGDAEMAGGYPLAGALLCMLGLDVLLALRLVSMLAAIGSVWLFERNLKLISPGARLQGRVSYSLLLLLLAPVFFRAGIAVMSDMLGLMLVLAVFQQMLTALDRGSLGPLIWAAFLAGLAVVTRFSMAVLLFPALLVAALQLIRMGHRMALFWMLLAGLIGLSPHYYLKMGLAGHVFDHSMFRLWSIGNFWTGTFENANGMARYTLPNILYVLFPLMHPGFCLLLPGLLLLSKKTDWLLPAKRMLLISLTVYLFFLAGIPHQNLRYLLPAYAILLLLLFPAWDRMVSYGEFFFPKIAFTLLTLTLLVQLAGNVYLLRPMVQRAAMERTMANDLRTVLPDGAQVYGFDVDIALQSYLPNLHWHNLWTERYPQFPNGAFVIFNEPALRTQWAGKNPMLNWENLSQNYPLSVQKTLPNGWVLYRIGTPAAE